MKRSFFILSKTISNNVKPRYLDLSVENKEYPLESYKDITNPWSGKPLNKKTNLDNKKIQNMLPEIVNNYFK